MTVGVLDTHVKFFNLGSLGGFFFMRMPYTFVHLKSDPILESY